MAGTTRLELATSAVTGQRSNQLNYVPAFAECAAKRIYTFDGLGPSIFGSTWKWWAVQGSNLRPPACKAGALTS